MAGDACIAIGIDHLAMLAHGKLLIEFVAAPQRVAHQGRPGGVFKAHPAEAFGRPEEDVLEWTGLRFQMPFLHQRRAAAFTAGAQRNSVGHPYSPGGYRWFCTVIRRNDSPSEDYSPSSILSNGRR